LNHPNILTIYEFGAENSVHFLATEFVEGETLRERLNNDGVSLKEAVEIAEQIAAALAAAHSAGIVHRDIKPENIMLREDRLVKVLDFGLAKLTEKREASLDTEAETRALVRTNPGVLMGTVSYMSPEQARGKDTDARTDVWSLGCVLYEMVTGKPPFAGETTSDIIASILKSKPPLLSHYVSDVPHDLEKIFGKALRKNADERYQNAKDLQIDLKHLRQELEFEAKLARSTALNKNRLHTNDKSGEQQTQILETEKATDATKAISTKGEIADSPVSSAEYIISEIKQHKRGFIAVLSILLIAAIGLGYWFYGNRSASNYAKEINSIAVLPFQNVSGDPHVEYLSDGIAESLINGLTQLQQLKVIARSTAFRFKGKDFDLQTIGRELNVRAVLTGRVRQMGDRLNIQVDLADASTGAQLWGAEYERKLSDVVNVEQEIAREVIEKLRLKLSGEQRQQLTKRDTANPEAYQLYLRGRFYWNKRTAENLKKAIEQFKAAADKDPNYALPYVGLADSYALLEQYTGTPPSETLPQAKAYAELALQIDDSLAEAHTSLGFVNYNLWQWAEAEKEFERAIELNRNYPTARHWYYVYLRDMGRFDEALVEIKRAQELDPLSLVINVSLTRAYLLKGDVNSCIEQTKKLIELYPNYAPNHGYLGLAYIKQGRHTEALAEMQKAVELERSSTSLSLLGYANAISGKYLEANAIIMELEGRYAKREVLGQDLAAVYAALGKNDQAFAWLEKDFQVRSGELSSITCLPTFDSLRNDPRYADLLRRMNLPQGSNPLNSK
jgi:serine/threonine-protein kinase